MPTPWPASLTLHQLEIFKAVAQEGGFSRAADALSMSEPAISNQIKDLERAFGVRLLERSRGRRQTELTSAGAILLRACDRAFAALGEGAAELREIQGLVTRSVSVGVSPTIGGHVLPGVYTAFRREHPRVDVQIKVGAHAMIVDGLLADGLDVGVLAERPEDPRLASVPLLAYELIIVGPPDHRLAGVDAAAPFEDIARERLILVSDQTIARRLLDRMAAERGLRLEPALELGDVDTLAQAVAAGLGISLMTSLSVAQRIADGRIAPLNVDGFPVRALWHLVHANRPLAPEVRAFVDAMLAACASPPQP